MLNDPFFDRTVSPTANVSTRTDDAVLMWIMDPCSTHLKPPPDGHVNLLVYEYVDALTYVEADVVQLVVYDVVNDVVQLVVYDTVVLLEVDLVFVVLLEVVLVLVVLLEVVTEYDVVQLVE